MSIKSLLIVFGLGIVLLSLLLPLSTAEFKSSRYGVAPGEVLDITENLGSKDRIVGFFVIRGEPPEIGFRILTPEGEPMVYHFGPPYDQFVEPDVVTGRHNFNFHAQSQGDYIMQFDNRNYSTDKEMDLRLTVMPAFYGVHPTNLLLILGFAVLFLGYLVEEGFLGKKYIEVLPEEFEHMGEGVFSWKPDPRVSVDLKKRGVEVIDELKKSGLKPRSKWGFYYSLRNRAGLE